MAKPFMCGDELPVYIPSGGCDCAYTMKLIESNEEGNTYALLLDGSQTGDSIIVPSERQIKTFYTDTGTTSNGTLNSLVVSISYTDYFVLDVRVEARMSGVSSGQRPVVTISNIPSDLPSFHENGSTTRGSSGSAVASDPCYINHLEGNTTMEITEYNYISAAPAGYVFYAI